MAELIDVSEHNGSVDWKKVAARVDGAYVRIADGDHRDPRYSQQRVDELRATKLTWGPYYFARVASPTNGQRTGSEEAKMAIGFAKEFGWRRSNDLPLAYDFEDLNGQPVAKAARHLVQFVRAYRKTMGHLPVIYTMPSRWVSVEREFNPKDRAFVKRCPLWIAHWGVKQPTIPQPWASYSLWQDTDHGRCAGVSGNVDHSRTSIALGKLTIGRHTQAEKPKPEQPGTPVTPDVRPAPTPFPTKKRPTGVPLWLPQEHWGLWEKPWTEKARRSQGFRTVLWEHGFASPHFSRDETRCHDPARSPVPSSLVSNAQRQAFYLEILRHELGDKPLAILSWYRTPAWNKAVGGATQSRHMQADATDFDVAHVDSFGPGRFDAVADRIYKNGGFGTYPNGSRHTDARGSRARWASF
jgi:GH25 family lysozyme M1 (1,4-beta-N-acetylmuramidase)